ncbi:MAG: hypothetical protein RPT94_01075 [Candidatus Sedimenticola sp. (ex Thyasira tokunagai)]
MTQVLDITPSEMLLLNGDKFASKGIIGNIELPLGIKVSAEKLGEALLANAFLTIEQEACVELFVGKQKQLFGLINSDRLFMKRSSTADKWPAPSVESELCALAQPEAVLVSDTLFDWLKKPHGTPWVLALMHVQHSMAQRGILHEESRKLLGMTVSKSYSLDHEKLAAIQQGVPEPNRLLMDNCKNSRPEVWKHLIKEIHLGINRRRAEDGGDDDGDD